jgi:TolB-like protein
MKKPNLVWCLAAFALIGCASVVEYGGTDQPIPLRSRVIVGPFVNATENTHAGQAMARLTATALMGRKVDLYQTEDLLTRAGEETGDTNSFLNIAREAGAAYMVAGTVHEYRYKTDLKGNPAVGITLRVVAVNDGRTIWQGSSSKVGNGFASLSATGQEAVRELVRRLPFR